MEGYLLSDSEKLLRDDDSLLRQLFFGIIQKQKLRLANRVDVIYTLAKSWCEDESVNDFEMLASAISELGPIDRVLVSVG